MNVSELRLRAANLEELTRTQQAKIWDLEQDRDFYKNNYEVTLRNVQQLPRSIDGKYDRSPKSALDKLQEDGIDVSRPGFTGGLTGL